MVDYRFVTIVNHFYNGRILASGPLQASGVEVDVTAGTGVGEASECQTGSGQT